MASQYLQELDASAAIIASYLIPVSNDPAGTGRLKKATFTQLVNFLGNNAFASLKLGTSSLQILDTDELFVRTIVNQSIQSEDRYLNLILSDDDITLTMSGSLNTGTGGTLGTSAFTSIDTDITLAANSDSLIATQKATKAYVDTMVTGLLEFKGSTDCSSNPNYPSGNKGDSYYVSVAGKIGGASGKSVEIGDVYVASADNAGGTEASVGTSWFVLEHNLLGAIMTSDVGTVTNTMLAGSIASSKLVGTDIVTVGTIAAGTWSATTIAVNKGGTGETSYTNGQLLIGNSTGNTLTKATLTGTTDQIVVTNNTGSITLSLPQSINTTSSPTFASLISPLVIGGTGTTSTLKFRTTSGVGTTNADMIFQVGNNGATEAMRILNSGDVGIGTAAPTSRLHVDANNTISGEIASYFLTATFPNIRGSFLHGGNAGGYLSAGGLQIVAQGANNSGSGSGNINFLTPNANSANVSTDATLSKRMIITSTGNVGIGTSTFGTSAEIVLALFNGTEPSTSPADTVQLYSVDLSAGNATLGLRTETAVVTETVISDRTLSIKINGTTYKVCLKS